MPYDVGPGIPELCAECGLNDIAFATGTVQLFGLKASKYVNALFFILPVLATMLSTLEVWSLCDIVVGLVIIPNLIALIALSPKFVSLFKEYKAKLKQQGM